MRRPLKLGQAFLCAVWTFKKLWRYEVDFMEHIAFVALSPLKCQVSAQVVFTVNNLFYIPIPNFYLILIET